MLKHDRDKDKYPQTIQNAIQKLKSLGFDEFKTDLPDYEQPNGFQQKNGTTKFVPDIVALRKGKKAYIEIAKKTDQIKPLVSKWKLLSTIASLNEVVFGIITPKGTVKFTKEVMETYNISANLIRI